MTTSQGRAGLDRSKWIAKCAARLLSSYRKDDFHDADGYAVQAAMVLERYDDAVIEAVTSPITGIQRTCAFPPSLAEVVAFIDDHVRRSTYAAQYDARSQEQLREREQFKTGAKAETPEHRKAVWARIKGELQAKGWQTIGEASR
jgi:hypothetical protein